MPKWADIEMKNDSELLTNTRAKHGAQKLRVLSHCMLGKLTLNEVETI
jgi:hypothetical protein